jgi:hypothetical protein
MIFNGFTIFILVSITILILYFKKFRFIDAFVFFIPFNATVVFFTAEGTAINLPFMLFILASISFITRKLFSPKFSIPKNRITLYSWLIILGLVIIISQIMPFIIDGKYNVLERYQRSVYWAVEVPLVPKTQWITQAGYFLIGLLVVFIISYTYKSKEEVVKLLKLLICGITFMIFWGWYGSFSFFSGIPYFQIFNHIGMWEFGVAKEAFNGFPRMTSVSMEPSYLAQMLIPITPFFYWNSQIEKPLFFSKIFHKRMYVFSLITLLIAITTTGVLGFFLIIGLLLINNIRFFSKRSKYFLIVIYSIVVIASIFLMIKYLIDVSGTYSGIERFKTVVYGYKYFLDYPILGLGWGVFPTYDFLINLLVNFGIMGAIPFTILIYNIVIKFKNKIKFSSKKDNYLYRAGIESFVLLIIVSQLSGFIYHSQYFWLYLGIAISIGSLELKKE